MSFWADYYYETRGVKVIEGIHGFASYLLSGDECYVEDVYVRPESRKTGVATKMVDEVMAIAGAHGCRYLTTSVNGRFKDPTTSLRSCLAYGFKIYKVVNDIIFLRMEIQNG